MHLAPIYRAPMRTRLELDLPPGAGAEYCIANEVVGIGSGASERAQRLVIAFARAPEGAFVWTRDRRRIYHLGRITGDLRVDESAGARAVGLTHVRPAQWLRRGFDEAEVPGAVARTFARGGRNFQRTHDDGAERRTAELWAASG